MTQTKTTAAEPLAKLRDPFADHHISKLPKETRAQIDARKADKNAMVFNCAVCGGHHHKNAVHLDYVGHAALTDRLLDTDIKWSWEPVAFTADGLPAFDRNGGLWIRLTVCGVTRLGYGSADGKSGGDAVKEIIGDALRNAAMRFGAALDLWHKGSLHIEEDHDPETGEIKNGKSGLRDQLEESLRQEERTTKRDGKFPDGPAKNKTELKQLGTLFWREVEGCGDPDELETLLASHKDLQRQISQALPIWWNGGTHESGEPYDGLATVISRKQGELALAAVNAG